MTKEIRITTKDNPFDPFDEFDNWLRFDEDKGYNTLSYVARLVALSDNLTEQENDEDIDQAIEDIVRFDPMQIYVKVERIFS